VTKPEFPVVFDCAGAALMGIVHPAAVPARRGVLIVVGGPQYRVGSHRQFLLLARALASTGIPAMRFDYRGMGDSDGEFRGFEGIGDDIAAAIAAFRAHCPALQEIVLWGLCDAASAIAFYAHTDPRVAGIVLLNPWVRTDAGEAKAYIKHYYRARLVDPEFWRKLATGGLDIKSSARSLLSLAQRALRHGRRPNDGKDALDRSLPLPDRMALGVQRYECPVLLILCGNDLTAHEFRDAAAASPLWQAVLNRPGVSCRELAPADHTFSRRLWRDEIIAWTVAWTTGLQRGKASGFSTCGF
jgi:exosortase A-associated hydrolase 1